MSHHEFSTILHRALRLNDFFGLARVGPAAEKQVTELVLGYIQSFPGQAESLNNVTSIKDDVERHHVYSSIANVMAKWFIRTVLVDPASDDEDTEEDRIWNKIQLCAKQHQ